MSSAPLAYSAKTGEGRGGKRCVVPWGLGEAAERQYGSTGSDVGAASLITELRGSAVMSINGSHRCRGHLFRMERRAARRMGLSFRCSVTYMIHFPSTHTGQKGGEDTGRRRGRTEWCDRLHDLRGSRTLPSQHAQDDATCRLPRPKIPVGYCLGTVYRDTIFNMSKMPQSTSGLHMGTRGTSWPDPDLAPHAFSKLSWGTWMDITAHHGILLPIWLCKPPPSG